MSKSTHFFGQPIYGQLINFLDKCKILRFSRQVNGERYVKSFNGWAHLVTMLYAVIMRFDSLREIEASMLAEVRKLHHLGLERVPRRSTLSDANARRPEKFFELVYRDLYNTYRDVLSSDSRQKEEKWMKRLCIMDSTTITQFSNLIFKGVGRNPKTGKKKGGVKVHTVIFANEGVPCDVRFTSAATHDSFMLIPDKFKHDEILAIDRAYIDYAKFEQLTQRGVIYVTKMKRNLTYKVISDTMYQGDQGVTVYRIQKVEFSKGETLHQARIITYYDEKRKKMISLLTNDFDMEHENIIAIYKKRWAIELLFKQIKQNFPLRYFYGESANAIKIQIWVTLIANLLLMLLQRSLKRSWSFSGLATMIRIVLMYYINLNTFFEQPEKDLKMMLMRASEPPPGESEDLSIEENSSSPI